MVTCVVILRPLVGVIQKVDSPDLHADVSKGRWIRAFLGKSGTRKPVNENNDTETTTDSKWPHAVAFSPVMLMTNANLSVWKWNRPTAAKAYRS
jgi:hypothetical protein